MAEQRDVMSAVPPKAKPPKRDPAASMSFLDHLEELRWRLFRGLIGMIAGIVAAFFFQDFIINELILGPTKKDFFMYQLIGIDAVELSLISRKLPGQFFTYWGTLIVVGFIIGSPIFFYQLWAFIAPALNMKEKLRTFGHTLFISFFFLLGVSFGYMILVPFAVQFFTQFVIADVIANEFDINEYFTSVSMWTLSCGVLFQIPVASFFLTKLELITPSWLRNYWRQAIVAIMVMAAVLTPPDPVSQVLIAAPLALLYQVAILTSKLALSGVDKSKAA